MDKKQYDPAQYQTGVISLLKILSHFGTKLKEDEFLKAHTEKDKDISWDILKKISKKYKLKAELIRPLAEELKEVPLPAITQMADGSYVNIIMINDAVVYLVDIRLSKPIALPMKRFLEAWNGDILTFQTGFNWAYFKKKYNLNFFLQVMEKYKQQLSEVLLACFFLQFMGIGMPLITQVIIDKVIGNGGYSTLTVIGISMVIFFTIQAVLTGLKTYVLNHTAVKLDAILGTKLFRHLISIPLPYYQNRRVGETLTRVNMMNGVREFLTGSGLTAILDVFFSVVFLAFMLWYSVPLTLIVLVVIPLYFVENVWAVPIYKKKVMAMANANIANQSFMVESMTNIETIKALAIEPQFNKKWEKLLAHFVCKAFDNVKFGLVMTGCSSTIQMISTLCIMWYGGHMVMDGEFTLGQLIAFQMIAAQALTPLAKLFGMWPKIQMTALGLEMLGDILNTAIEPVLIDSIGKRANRLSGKIELQNVKFRYRIDTPLVLNGINLKIEPGQKIGIVGRSGSGKSTLTNVVQFMYQPEEGDILFDGLTVREINIGWLRSQIGVVMQENYLFDSSIRDNIAVNKPNAKMDEVIAAAKMAGAHEFILELKEGYDTKVGERGSSLSGGQRQRIAIARALMDNPPILIFDEATSALDYESERTIMQNMDQIGANRTMLIIAHRLSTVRRCDRIIVVDKGQIIEDGSHDELMAAQGAYYSLYNQQEGVK
ncbi:MAG: peptidase domain-containing ABC transporter [Selenomonadales bacterium]|nr:peptidase domain-containing ABC transporter [Selenomonadales bacterium]